MKKINEKVFNGERSLLYKLQLPIYPVTKYLCTVPGIICR